MNEKKSRMVFMSIYRHKATGDYFLYFDRGRQGFATVAITEEQAEKTSALLGIELQVTMVPEITKRRLP